MIKRILDQETPTKGLYGIFKHELELPCFLAMHVFQFTLLASGLFLNAMLAVSQRKLRIRIETELGLKLWNKRTLIKDVANKWMTTHQKTHSIRTQECAVTQKEVQVCLVCLIPISTSMD